MVAGTGAHVGGTPTRAVGAGAARVVGAGARAALPARGRAAAVGAGSGAVGARPALPADALPLPLAVSCTPTDVAQASDPTSERLGQNLAGPSGPSWEVGLLPHSEEGRRLEEGLERLWRPLWALLQEHGEGGAGGGVVCVHACVRPCVRASVRARAMCVGG